MKSHIINQDVSSEMFRKEHFKSDNSLTKEVREALNADDILLTDGIILAPLHVDVAKELSADAIHTENFWTIWYLHFLGSICHALSSRVKDDKYAEYRNVNWLEKSAEYHAKANVIQNAYKIQDMVNGK